MWQFMDGTAREYRLKTQGQCDGRQDVIQATGSAIRLLTDLRRDFGDWHLALAAYNAGATRVREAQKKNLSENKSTDFWALDSLAKETQLYVPRLLALRELVSEQMVLDEPLPWLPAQPLLKVVDTPPGSWSAVAERTGMPVPVLRQLNPCWQDGPKQKSLILVPTNLRKADWIGQWLG